MKTHLLVGLFLVLIISCKKEADTSRKASPPDQTEINKLKINQLQILGSHNSYHKHMDQRLFTFLENINFLLPAKYKVEDLDYAQEPLVDQLDVYGLRSFEIDIYNDPNGGLFYNRNANRFVHMTVESHIAELQQPGLKVLHIPDIDYETHYYTFKSMLRALKDWSDAHPNHIPIFLLVETKEETVGDVLGFLGFTTAIKYTPALADNIDVEIKSVFGDDLKNLITPDMVRGSYPTLEAGVLEKNWPTVGESRGKFIITMQGGAENEYLQGHPSLQGRAMFVMSDPGKPEAAFIGDDDPVKSGDTIPTQVRAGYIVRTRTDDPNKQNKTGDYRVQNAAFASGAQMISTDYYRPDPRYITSPGIFTNYSCKFPNNELARINLISAPDKQGAGIIAE